MAKFTLSYKIGSENPISCDGELYRVRMGDTLFEISRRKNVPLEKLIEANPQIENPDVIKPGQKICIPRYEPDPDEEPEEEKYCWRFALLEGTDYVPNAVGFALVKPDDPGWVVVVGFNLPAPSSFGNEFDTYKAWFVEPRTFSRFRLDMCQIADDVWIVEDDNRPSLEFDRVMVTPESSPGITTPTGPTVLEGNLTKKC